MGDRDIDILKIDVEGWERAVIDGADWDRWRPRAIVVKSGALKQFAAHCQAWQTPPALAAGGTP